MTEQTLPGPRGGILLDIEGTTTPISFVTETLFPYARSRMAEFLRAHSQSSDILPEIESLRVENEIEQHAGKEPPEWMTGSRESELQSAIAYVGWLMDRDRKSTGLKSLQGQIWERGYRTGELQGRIFPDVPPALRRWKKSGADIRIFSSGSVLAQKLLFTYSEAGDLTPFLAGYFDTRTGSKKSAESYRKIADACLREPVEILYISDVVEELDAAQEAGLDVALCIRPGSREQPHRPEYPVIRSFDEILG